MKNIFQKLKKNIILVIFLSLFLVPCFNSQNVFAKRDFVNDWYIKNFDATITVNKNSTLDVVEKITADCGQAIGKHGIFRTLPEETKIKNGRTIKTPIKLISITDFSGKPYKYKTIRENKTITWKIGNPNKTVQGVHNYLIHYKVGNVIRFQNPSFDEFYWNILGTFWELDIDNFHAQIIFPKEVSKENSQVEYYTGYLGSKLKKLADYSWTSPNVLEFYSTQPLEKGQGITISVTFPKNIFKPYHFSLWRKYGKYFPLAIPLVVFLVCFYFWWKYGRDPKIKKPIIPFYEPPENLSPLEMGVLMNGSRKIKKEFITAEIINLAVKSLITIKEIEENTLGVFHSKDYLLIRNSKPEIEENLTKPQKIILKNLFIGLALKKFFFGKEIGKKTEDIEKSENKLSSLKISFFKCFNDIKKETVNILVQKGLITKKGTKSFKILSIAVLIFISILSSFIFSSSLNIMMIFCLFLSLLIISIFSNIMPCRTLKGAEVNWKIKGFKLFMKTVDKDRAKFYEKENIFEKLLPYAIVFGITDIWIKRMEEIYGEDYFSNYAPAWYVGTVGSFNTESFSKSIDFLSSAIASSVSSSSGVGGGGSAGGGSGGGGGGGW